MEHGNADQAKIAATVIVPVRNEERNLARCLSKLGDFAHVLVVDSGSTDATPEIARAHGAELVDFSWNGRFPKKRNWVLTTVALPTDWVLFLDADEIVSDAFCSEVKAAIARSDVAGYWIQYTSTLR